MKVYTFVDNYEKQRIGDNSWKLDLESVTITTTMMNYGNI